MTGHIPREERKKIIWITDTPLGISGVANVARAIITNTAGHFNYVVIGVSLDPQHKGKHFDISEQINKEIGITDSSVKVVGWDKYDEIDLIRDVCRVEKPDGLVFITDPRSYTNLEKIALELQHQGIALTYINIWDSWPAPFYNRALWSSVNLLLAINKQTVLMNQIVTEGKVKVEYFPHGVNTDVFKPIPDQELLEFKKQLVGGHKFVLFFNSRNIGRKSITTSLLAFKAFLKRLSPEQAKECCFLLHTSPVDHNGTDLHAVIHQIFNEEEKKQIIFDEKICSPEDLNKRYNIADATILLSDNEGFGLSGLESIAVGTPIIVNMTGGMQDYCRVLDDEGNWFTPSEKIWSNHTGVYKSVGSWVFPVYPNNLHLAGSVPTPYIFSDRCHYLDAAEQIADVYDLRRSERKYFGSIGRKWIMQQEIGMTEKVMCENFIKHVDDLLENFTPVEKYSITKVDGPKVEPRMELPDYLFERN